MYDIGIIGGGTAGLTAAIYGQRAGKRTLVIEGLNFWRTDCKFTESRELSGIGEYQRKPVFYESAESGNEAGSRDCFRACKRST